MMVLVFFYKFWHVISIASVVVGILVIIVDRVVMNKSKNKLMKVLKYISAIVCTISVIFSACMYLMFTKVPKVTEVSVDSATTTLRENNLEVGYLPNMRYDDLYLNCPVTFQSIEGGQIVPKGTVIYIEYAQVIDHDDVEKETPSDEIIAGEASTGETTLGETPTGEASAEEKPTGEGETENPSSKSDFDLGFEDQNVGKVIVPDVVGMEQNDAIATLYMAGLQFQVYWYSNGESNNNRYYVVDQSYDYGDNVNMGTLVRVELATALPESISPKNFMYEQNDLAVRSSSELNGFYVYSRSVTAASYYNAVTNEVSHPSYLPEKLCQVRFVMIGVDNAIMSIYMEENDTGICIDNNEGKAELFINRGFYRVDADFGNNIKSAYVYIDSSGEYTIDFTY